MSLGEFEPVPDGRYARRFVPAGAEQRDDLVQIEARARRQRNLPKIK